MHGRLRWAGALLLAWTLGCAASASAQSFSDFVVFGDSLSDSGNAAQALGLPSGTSFTTNPDPVWAEIVARGFGASGANSIAGGSNYAFSGACVNPATPCDNTAVATITEQIDAYLSSARVDPDALYAIWGGANDIADSAVNDSANALGHTLAAAAVHAAQAKRLLEAGARYVVVINAPDVGLSPYAASLGSAAQAAVSSLADAYNEKLDADIRTHEDGVVPVNVHGIFDEIVENPSVYGITNTTGTACKPEDSTQPISLGCGPEGSGTSVTYAAGDNEKYLFADRSHPTGVVHAAVANLVTSTLAAPLHVSLAGEAGIQTADVHRTAVASRQSAGFALPAGRWRVYAAGSAGSSDLGTLAQSGKAEADLGALTIGASRREGADLTWGAALTLARHENESTGANLDADAALASLHGAWRSGGLEIGFALSLGQTSLDVERKIVLAAATRTESGSTRASLLGADLDLAWTLAATQTFRHGPFFAISWLDQQIKGYKERGASASAMHFSDFSRNSVRARGGWRAAWSLGALHPYAHLGYERELEDEPVRVTAGSNTMPGRFTAEGYAPAGGAFTADLGVRKRLGESASALLGYAGRFGENARDTHRVSLSVRVLF